MPANFRIRFAQPFSKWSTKSKVFTVIAIVVILALSFGLGFGLPRASPSPTTTPSSSFYTLEKSWTGAQLHASIGTDFRYFEAVDPTQGYVNYGAHTELLSIVDETKLKINLGQNAPGPRNAIRLVSESTFDTGLVVFDVEHLPEDLSNWPAFWTEGKVDAPSSWAYFGEIDVIEQVNNSTTNLCTLHTNTNPGEQPCTMDPSLGFGSRSDCFATSGPQTCGFESKDFCPFEGCGKSMGANTFGSSFNNAGGGVFAMQLTATGQITVWFWTRAETPPDFASATSDAFDNFTDRIIFSACPNQFSRQQIILNTDLCGDFAGAPHPPEWTDEAGCEAYVDSHTLSNSYWTVRSLKLYSIN